MLIANKLRNRNRSAYIVYMWQLEDILRGLDFNAERVASELADRFDADQDTRKEMAAWYGQLCTMMLEEGCRQRGHLQICKNAVQELEELHAALLRSEKIFDYRALYERAKPIIGELRLKQGEAEAQQKSDVEIMLEALYLTTMLRLKGEKVSEETLSAVGQTTKLLDLLSTYYERDRAGELTDLE